MVMDDASIPRDLELEAVAERRRREQKKCPHDQCPPQGCLNGIVPIHVDPGATEIRVESYTGSALPRTGEGQLRRLVAHAPETPRAKTLPPHGDWCDSPGDGYHFGRRCDRCHEEVTGPSPKTFTPGPKWDGKERPIPVSMTRSDMERNRVAWELLREMRDGHRFYPGMWEAERIVKRVEELLQIDARTPPAPKKPATDGKIG